MAQGLSLAEILPQLSGTAEGINTTKVLIQIADREGIAVPISRQVWQLLQGKITPQAAIKALMARDLKPE